MATADAFDAIRSFVEAAWPDSGMACPIAWDNEPFQLPAPYDDQDQPQHWLKLLIDGRQIGLHSIGTGDPRAERWVESGDLIVLAMVPVRSGSRRCRQVLQAFADLCRGVDAGPITFGDVTWNPIGSTDEAGNWWSLQILIEWTRG